MTEVNMTQKGGTNTGRKQPGGKPSKKGTTNSPAAGTGKGKK